MNSCPHCGSEKEPRLGIGYNCGEYEELRYMCDDCGEAVAPPNEYCREGVICAEYIGEMSAGGNKLKLYNIIGGHLHGGTVSKETLIKMGIEVPNEDNKRSE